MRCLLTLIVTCCAGIGVHESWGADETLCLHYAQQLASGGDEGVDIGIVLDDALGHPEAFTLGRDERGNLVVRAGGAGGALYGVREAMGGFSVVGAEGVPDFDTRGAVLMMMNSGWTYQSDLSPEVYPWFFDRALMTRYLDYLLSARLNTLVLWAGHMFPHILELPDDPEATHFSPEELRRNQDQFRWLATEAARRNISVLLHFYNIHLSEHMAQAHGRTTGEAGDFRAPDDFLRRYYTTILTRYFEEFPGVGLYICPGETLAAEHQHDWFRDVIFKAARDSGKNPQLVIRDWIMDPGFKEALPGMYDNLYSEMKHNDESLTSPWPDTRHETWRGKLRGHIVNLHDPCDITPYRVGSPRLLGEMIGHWKDADMFMGAWFYPPQAWSWPHTLDIVQTDDGPATGTLIGFERDALWHLLEGRYLWRADRDPEEETAWTAAWLGRRFGNDRVGELLAEWYDLTGPILPGLQNLTAIRFANFFPTAVAPVQADVDEILASRESLDDPELDGTVGLVNQRYSSRPVDEFTIERYLAQYPDTRLKTRYSMPVAQYAELKANDETIDWAMSPDRLMDVYQLMAEEAVERAREAATLPNSDPDEIARFITDAQALAATVQYYRCKIDAAILKRTLELTGNGETEFRDRMQTSVAAYEQLINLARRHYTAASSMFAARTWEGALEEKVRGDLHTQLEWLESREPAGSNSR